MRTNGSSWTRSVGVLVMSAAVSACAAPRLACQYPTPPPELIQPVEVDSQSQLIAFYKSLQPTLPEAATETAPSSTP